MNATLRSKLARSKSRLERRLDPSDLRGSTQPMFTASNIHYEFAERTRGLGCGGIGAFQLLARKLGLIDAIDDRLHLLKVHLPYHESDHVLNLAYNALCGGTCLDDIELHRQDEVFLDALGARRIPDPTTAGDFCRRFRRDDILILLDIFDETRVRAWSTQPPEFFAQAIIDLDGHLVETTGECKAGMDIAYDGTWGYHPLLVTLANTGEVLRLVNRSGNRPSHEGAAEQADRAIAVCRRGGFRTIRLRGDTDFSQSAHLDRWDDDGVAFNFGYEATANLKARAEDLPETAWKPRRRPPRYQVQTEPRQRPDRVKDRMVKERAFEKLTLQSEHVAEFAYRPTACRKTYRMVVVRKNIAHEKGEKLLFDEVRYFFYLSNDRLSTPSAIVFDAHERCQQENLIEQLRNGIRALRAPVDNLESNWAYMVMTALAWNLKAWWALQIPAIKTPGRRADQRRQEKRTVLRMEFKTFANAFLKLPCQSVRTSRRLSYRLLSWNPWQTVFFRVLTVLRC